MYTEVLMQISSQMVLIDTWWNVNINYKGM